MSLGRFETKWAGNQRLALMPARALTAAEVAAELGRGEDWLRRQWPELAKREGFPRPLHAQGTLVWSAAPHPHRPFRPWRHTVTVTTASDQERAEALAAAVQELLDKQDDPMTVGYVLSRALCRWIADSHSPEKALIAHQNMLLATLAKARLTRIAAEHVLYQRRDTP